MRKWIFVVVISGVLAASGSASFGVDGYSTDCSNLTGWGTRAPLGPPYLDYGNTAVSANTPGGSTGYMLLDLYRTPNGYPEPIDVTGGRITLRWRIDYTGDPPPPTGPIGLWLRVYSGTQNPDKTWNFVARAGYFFQANISEGWVTQTAAVDAPGDLWGGIPLDPTNVYGFRFDVVYWDAKYSPNTISIDEFSIVPGGTITGLVNDTRGNVVVGATVTASPGGWSTTTGSNGTYTLAGVPVGTSTLTVSNPPTHETQVRTGVVVTKGATRTENFTLATTSTMLTGTVRDSSGKPIPGAYVGIKSTPYATADPDYTVKTDNNGGYSRLLANGTYNLGAWLYGYAASPDAVIVVTGTDLQRDITLTAANANVAPTYTALYATSEDPGGGMGKEKAVDGNFSTRWTTGNPLPNEQQDQSWIIDFGAPKTLTGITTFWEAARPSDYSIEVTNDDPNPANNPAWTTIYSKTGSTGGFVYGYGVGVQAFRFSPTISPRGVRVHVTKFGPYPVYSAWEFQLYGTGPGNAYGSITDVKQLPDNTLVDLLKWVSVSGVYNGGESTLFRDTFWIEEADRSSAIRVEAPGHYCWPGELDQVSGTVQTDSVTGERYIQASGWGYFDDLGSTPAPYAMTGRAMETSLPWALVVKTAGKVTEQLDDGYMLDDGSTQPIKVVKEEPLPPVGAFVVTEGALKPGSASIYEQKANIDGFLFQWLMHGAYSVPNPGTGDLPWQQANLNQDFLAVQGGEANIEPGFGDVGPNGGAWFGYSRKPWESYVFGLNNPPVPWIPSGQNQACIYASTWVLADRVYDGQNDGVEIWVGSDDGYKIWLNGVVIGENNIWRGTPPVENWDKYPATGWEGDLYNIQPGWNHILVKVNNIYGGWAFGVRLMMGNGASPLNLPYYSPIEYSYTP